MTRHASLLVVSYSLMIASSASAQSSYEVEGNPSCADLGFGGIEVKIDPPTGGTYDIIDGYTVRIETDGHVWSFDSDLAVDAAISKGGDGAIVDVYDPEALIGGGLVAPINASDDNAALSHMQLCIDFELEVSLDVSTCLTREYQWSIDLEGDVTDLLLSQGQTYPVSYTTVVTNTGSTDSNHTASALVTVTNPAPMAAEVTEVEALLNGQATPITCDLVLPATLAPQDSFDCVVDADMADGTPFDLEVIAHTGTIAVGGGSAAGTGTFDTVCEEIDACVDVDDTLYGFLGSVCVDTPTTTFEYVVDINADSCTTFEVPSDACLTAIDTQAQSCDSWSVWVDVACDAGCSLTPGYWKTHSAMGPASYDDNWAQLSDGSATTFFLSGDTWHGVLWTPPKGNAYYILAHAYQAAALNQLNGADTSAVTAELAEAEAFFATASPADSLRGQARNDIIELATVLDDYNNGLIGPGHCSE